MRLQNKIAIGILVQWYEIELIPEYFQSLENAIEYTDNDKNIIVDICFNMSQSLEKIDEKQISLEEIESRFYGMLSRIRTITKVNYKFYTDDDKPYTIADYRREFNDRYCEEVDILMWGESDSLIPRQAFSLLDSLHENVKDQTPKYVGFFGGCKMWDKSWEPIEHTEFTDKPFIEMDTENWWSLRYNMTVEEMNGFNDKVEEPDVRTVNPKKFNGCGLVISSDVIKCGVNIPRSVFFVHEDTAFMHILNRVLPDIPQYVFKNILLVHNRKHPKKRSYILGEDNVEPGDVGSARKTHSWYEKANQLCEQNAYSLFSPQHKVFIWKDVFE